MSRSVICCGICNIKLKFLLARWAAASSAVCTARQAGNFAKVLCQCVTQESNGTVLAPNVAVCWAIAANTSNSYIQLKAGLVVAACLKVRPNAASLEPILHLCKLSSKRVLQICKIRTNLV